MYVYSLDCTYICIIKHTHFWVHFVVRRTDRRDDREPRFSFFFDRPSINRHLLVDTSSCEIFCQTHNTSCEYLLLEILVHLLSGKPKPAHKNPIHCNMKFIGVLSVLATLREATAFTAPRLSERCLSSAATSLRMSGDGDDEPVLNKYSR